jgi:hypothetical protein
MEIFVVEVYEGFVTGDRIMYVQARFEELLMA